jgi:hypothetical protein
MPLRSGFSHGHAVRVHSRGTWPIVKQGLIAIKGKVDLKTITILRL